MDNSILFVDDQQEILDILKKFLENEPYKCFFAASVEKGLEILKKENVSVIVTDMSMPDINGLDFLKRIKVDYPEMVRIVLSGHTHISMVLEAINNGEIFKYIPKPWKIDDEAKQILRTAIEYYNNKVNEKCSLKSYLEIDSVVNMLNDIGVRFKWFNEGKMIFSNVLNENEVEFLKENNVDKVNKILVYSPKVLARR